MPFYEKKDVRIHYEEAGSGFPLLLIPGGGLNSNIGVWASSGPFDAMAEFKTTSTALRRTCATPTTASRRGRSRPKTPGTATPRTSWA
jgi:hypothetical protein